MIDDDAAVPARSPADLRNVLEFRSKDLGFVAKKDATTLLRLVISKDRPESKNLRATFEWRAEDRVLATDTFVPLPHPEGIRGWIQSHGPARWTVVRSADGSDPAPLLPIPFVDGGED